MRKDWDIVIVGAGMAGASLAAALSAQASLHVLLLEAEAHPGYHATGRSAAFWTESYGGPGIVPLTVASGPELRILGVLRRRGALTLAREGQERHLEHFMASFAALGVRVEAMDRTMLERHLPGLQPGWVAGAFETDCCDIDVAQLHQHYLATARKNGVEVVCSARLTQAERQAGGWRLILADGREFSAGVLVNAAGAWADAMAAMAGVNPLRIIPYRRTMVQLRITPPPPVELPLVLDLDGSFYFKPGGDTHLWLSPHDETPSPPCDAAPEEVDVATAVARLATVTDWRVERIEHRWAGLRSFAPDRLPVYGFDRTAPGFFWFAGQGGFGIQTAPAAARLAVALLTGRGEPPVDPVPYAPARFRT